MDSNGSMPDYPNEDVCGGTVITRTDKPVPPSPPPQPKSDNQAREMPHHRKIDARKAVVKRSEG
jgi:hypothetical protein